MINKGLSSVTVFFLYVISLLPMPILYLISDGLYYILYYLIKYRRAVVKGNLARSFPNKTPQELQKIEKKYFRYLADLVVEIVKMVSAPPSFFVKRFSFTNMDLLNKYHQEKRSYLFGVGHYGNWEWSCIVTPLVVPAKPLIIYKPLNNAYFNDFFTHIREKGGAKMIKMKVALREIVKHKNELTVTVFASDQTPHSSEIHEWVDFLNQPTPIFMGLEKIAKATNAPVIFCDIERVKRGFYSCDFKLISENPRETAEMEITQKHVAILEDRINAEPSFWLWSHKRWKYKPD